MTEQQPLFQNVDDVYNGSTLALPYRDIVGEGVVGNGDMKATAVAGALQVQVATGDAWVRGDSDDEQPTYRCRLDADKIIQLAAADATYTRIDLIVAQIHDADFDGGTQRSWAVTYIEGVPAAAPAAPAVPDSAMPIAEVSVPTNAADSSVCTITDLRRWSIAGGSTSPWSMGPPANPRHNETWEAEDVKGDGGDVRWQFRYNARTASAYKWEFVGGPAVKMAYDGAGTAWNSGAFSTNGGYYWYGPGTTWAGTRPGDWEVHAKQEFVSGTTTGGQCSVSAVVGSSPQGGEYESACAAAAGDTETLILMPPVVNVPTEGEDVGLCWSYPAGTVLYRTVVEITPFRIA